MRKQSSILNIFTFLCLFLFGTLIGFSQDEEHKEEKKHSIAVLLSHTQVHEAVSHSGDKKWLSVPSFELNYTYEINETWGIGLHTDFVLEEFNVEHISEGEDKIIERSTPVAPALVGIYNFCNNFSALVGCGGEFAKEESFFLVRLGIEYGYEFHEDWELVSNLTNDLKIDGYNSFSLGIGVARKF